MRATAGEAGSVLLFPSGGELTGLDSAQGTGRLISFRATWGLSGAQSVCASFSVEGLLLRRLLISMMFPMISTGPVTVFLRGEMSSFTFFR